MRSIAILAMLFFAKLLVAQNLIVNPGAEDPSLTGWTIKNGLWSGSNTSFGEKVPRSGNFHFYAGDNNPYDSELYQDVDLSAYASNIDAGTATVSFTGYITNYAFNNDRVQMIIEYRNVSDNILLSLSLPNTPYTGSTWSPYSDLNRVPPTGTSKVRVRLISIYRSGSASDGYFDDLSLTITIPTPVTLVFFHTQNQGNQALCTWQTANESNNIFFVVEKSTDGLQWTGIGQVAGNTNTTTATSYEFLDPNPLERLQYYRLKQVDLDGKFTYSQTRFIHQENDAQLFNIYANTEDHIVIAGAYIRLLDVYKIDGQVYSQYIIHESEERSTVIEQLPSGSYIFKITTEAEVYSFKYIVP